MNPQNDLHSDETRLVPGEVICPAVEAPSETRVAGIADATVPGPSASFTRVGAAPVEFPTIAGEGTGKAQTRFGEYEIVRQIAKGGMGSVYEARHVRLGLPVALKMISAGDAATESDVQRFLVEAQAVAKLHKHQNIVKIYSISEETGQLFFAMQLIRGGSLKDHLIEYSADPRRSVELMIRVAEAIAHAHRRGVLHRDLKPDNILIDEEGIPYVTDFGLAKRVDPTERGGMTVGPAPAAQARRQEPLGPSAGVFESSQTQGGLILGTPSFMPPEQAQGRLKDISTLSDVYGLGSTLFTLLCARPPFVGTGVRDILDQVISEPPPSPRALNKRVDRDLEAICLKCLEKDPKRRYESAEAFARELRRWLDGKPVYARPVSRRERVAKWSRREPLQATAAGLGVALLGLAAALAVSIAVESARLRDANHATEMIEQRRKALAQEKALADERAKLAQANSSATLKTAGEAVMSLLDVFETELGDDAQQQALRNRILVRALHYFKSVIQKQRGMGDEDASSRLELAKAYQRVAALAGKIGSNRHEEVTKSYVAAIAILEELARPLSPEANDPEATTIRAELGNAYHEYGIIRWEGGEPEAAFELYEKGRNVREQACQVCKVHGNQRACGCVGDTAVRTGLGRSWGYIGDVHVTAGRVEEAEKAYKSSHRIRQKLYDDLNDDPEVGAEVTIQLARSFGNLAWLARRSGDLETAVIRQQDAIDLLNSLLKKSLRDVERRKAREDLSAAYRQVAVFRLENGEPEKAVAIVSNAIVLVTALIQEKPGALSYRIAGAATELVLSEAALERGDVPQATEACQQAEKYLESAKDFLGVLDYRLARVHWDRLTGMMALRDSRPGEASEPLSRAKDILDSLIAQDPKNDEYRSDRAEILAFLAETHRALADNKVASDMFKKALTEQESIIKNGGEESRIKLFQTRLKRFEAMRPEFE